MIFIKFERNNICIPAMTIHGGRLKFHLRNDQTVPVFLLLLFTVALGFFIPATSSGGLIVKIILFILFLVLLYLLVFGSDGMKFLLKKLAVRTQETMADAMPEEAVDDSLWSGFGDAFRLYVQELLTVIRSAVVASCAGFYMQRGNDGLEFNAGENEHGHWNRRMFIDDGSLVDHVAKQKVPVLEDNLPIGTSLDGLPNAEIRSFLGVPLIRDDEVAGVLALGSNATQSFGEADQEFLVRCGELLSHVMTVCRRGLQWEMDQEVFRVLVELHGQLVYTEDEDGAVSHFVKEIRKLFSFDRFTLCIKEGNEGVIHHVYGQVDDFDRGTRFSLNEGLNGWIIKRNAPMIIADVEKGDYVRPRYYRDEYSKHGLRSFLGIPLGRGEEAWGCMSLESRLVNQYSEKGKDVLVLLSEHLYSTLERISLLSQLRELGQGGNTFHSPRFRME